VDNCYTITMLNVLCFDCGGMFQVSYETPNPTKQCPKCQGIKSPL
jgi:hypothetical protein